MLTLLQNLSSEQVEELYDDIERYLSLEHAEVNLDFWTVCLSQGFIFLFSLLQQNMMVVCKDRLDRIKANQRMGTEAAAAVESDITALLSGKSYDHLVTLQKQIQAKLTSGEPVDIDYWEGLLKKLLVWKAKVQWSLSSHLQLSHRFYRLN